MAIFPNQIKYASGAVLRNGSFKWEKMPAAIKSSRSERRKGPVTVMSSFHWVTAQITGCPLGGGGGNSPSTRRGGKNSQNKPFLESSTTTTITNWARWIFCFDKCPVKIYFNDEKSWRNASSLLVMWMCGRFQKCDSLSADWPHFLPVHRWLIPGPWEWNQPYLPLDRLPASVHPGRRCDKASNHTTAVSINFISCGPQSRDTIFQWQRFCFGPTLWGCGARSCTDIYYEWHCEEEF